MVSCRGSQQGDNQEIEDTSFNEMKWKIAKKKSIRKIYHFAFLNKTLYLQGKYSKPCQKQKYILRCAKGKTCFTIEQTETKNFRTTLHTEEVT